MLPWELPQRGPLSEPAGIAECFLLARDEAVLNLVSGGNDGSFFLAGVQLPTYARQLVFPQTTPRTSWHPNPKCFV